MPRLQHLHFEHFLLDPLNAQLLQNGLPIQLTPKAYAVLAFLCQHPGRLVSKEDLLDAVWQRRFVSEGVLKNTIQELRRALGDDPKSPRFIETIHRRGYRFIAWIHGSTPNDATSPQPIVTTASIPIVGRESLLHILDQYLDMTLAGNPCTVFINGEPGIGKTALIQSFVQRAGSRGLCIQGQCVEQYGQGEPYLPLLEAINQLARYDGEDCVRQLRQYAPSWLAQLPWLIGEADREWLQHETSRVTKTRMLRELGEFLKHRAEASPLLLVIEDIHWSDHATMDAVTYLSRRKDGTRLMILGSYRPADVVIQEHPFKLILNELLAHGLCHDLPLQPLAMEDVDQYLRMRFAVDALPNTTVQAVFRRTEGLPLFLVRIADEMEKTSSANFEQALASLPDGLKHLIDLQFDRLSATEKSWLDAAAVCGKSFMSETLAAVTATSHIEVEAWCEKQVDARLLQRVAFEEELSAVRYAFIHAYYQELAYARTAPIRKAALHSRVGEWIETAYGSRRDDLAAELAMHYERGRQYETAARHLHQAARNALHRHATLEASRLLQQGIDLLDTYLPDTLENQHRKLELLALLHSALIATRGYGAPELPAIHNRTLELATQLKNHQVEYCTLYGIWMFHSARGELETALVLANELYAMADSRQDEKKLMAACLALGSTLMFAGQNSQATEWLDRGLGFAAGLDFADDHSSQIFGQDLQAGLMAFQSITLQMLGYSDRSLRLMQAARNRAEAVGHPYTETFVLFCSVWLHRDRAEPERVRDYLPQFEQLSIAHGFPVLINSTRIFSGWASAILDGNPAGIALIHQAIDLLGTLGLRLTKSIYYHQLAEACLCLGLNDEGLQAIDSAMTEIAFTGERRYEAESLRLRGELLLRSGTSGEETPEACFNRALTIATTQNAKVFRLRAAASLVRIQQPQDQKVESAQRLRSLCEQFDEGHGTPDWIATNILLDQLVENNPQIAMAISSR